MLGSPHQPKPFAATFLDGLDAGKLKRVSFAGHFCRCSDAVFQETSAIFQWADLHPGQAATRQSIG